jgi:hypothetical protein
VSSPHLRRKPRCRLDRNLGLTGSCHPRTSLALPHDITTYHLGRLLDLLKQLRASYYLLCLLVACPPARSVPQAQLSLRFPHGGSSSQHCMPYTTMDLLYHLARFRSKKNSPRDIVKIMEMKIMETGVRRLFNQPSTIPMILPFIIRCS